MNMNDTLSRIFNLAPDILSPRDFAGEAFTKGEDESPIFTIIEIRDGASGPVTAVVHTEKTPGPAQPFPSHVIFSQAVWQDDVINQKIEEALAAIEDREVARAARIVKERSQRERDAALKVLGRLIPTIAFVPDGEETARAGKTWCDVVLALDVIFEDIQSNDERSSGFIAETIARTQEWHARTFLSEKQQEWIKDVAERAITRHRSDQPSTTCD